MKLTVYIHFNGEFQDVDNDQIEHYILASKRKELKMTQHRSLNWTVFNYGNISDWKVEIVISPVAVSCFYIFY